MNPKEVYYRVRLYRKTAGDIQGEVTLWYAGHRMAYEHRIWRGSRAMATSFRQKSEAEYISNCLVAREPKVRAKVVKVTVR